MLSTKISNFEVPDETFLVIFNIVLARNPKGKGRLLIEKFPLLFLFLLASQRNVLIIIIVKLDVKVRSI